MPCRGWDGRTSFGIRLQIANVRGCGAADRVRWAAGLSRGETATSAQEILAVLENTSVVCNFLPSTVLTSIRSAPTIQDWPFQPRPSTWEMKFNWGDAR